MDRKFVLSLLPILFVPAFPLAKVILTGFMPMDGFAYLHQNHLLFLMVLIGAFSIAVYFGSKNILSYFPKLKPRLLRLIAFAFSLILIIIVSRLFIEYIASLVSFSENEISLSWPAMFSDAGTPVVIFLGELLITILGTGIISFFVSTLVLKIKSTFAKKYRISPITDLNRSAPVTK